MRKNTIYLAIFLVLSLLLFTSCKPAGKAIAGVPVAPADLSGYPRNVVKLDDFNNKILFNIKANTAYGAELNVVTGKIMTELCQLVPDTCAYNTGVTTDETSFMAVGTCDEVGQYLDASLCPLSQGKALIQYIDNYKLVVAGGTQADVKKALEILANHNNWLLTGYYSDIINTDKIVAASHITGTNSVEYVEKFFFTQGKNKITNPLTLPSNKQAISNFFMTVSDKINRIYNYDSTTNSYTGVYNDATTDNAAPSNLVHFGVTDSTYIVDAKEGFSVTITNAKHPTITTLAGISTIDPYYTRDVVNAFMTGASIYGTKPKPAGITGGVVLPINRITGGAVAGEGTTPMYRCVKNFHGVYDHYFSHDSSCDGYSNDGLMGYLYDEREPDTVAIKRCYRQIRYERPGHEKRTFTDYFPAIDSCPDGSTDDGIHGYAPASAITGETKNLYLCEQPGGIRQSAYDRMLSESVACEGYANQGVVFNFLINPIYTDDTKPLYGCRRYSGAKEILDHYVATSYPCGGAGDDIITQTVLGRIYEDPHPETKVLSYCYWPNKDDHLVSLDGCDPGTEWRADIGYVYETQQEGTIPLIRCRFTANDEHYLLSGTTTCNPDSALEATYYILPYCTSQDGRNISSQGVTTSLITGKKYTDYCREDKLLMEYSCDAETVPDGVKKEEVTCDMACQAGRCIGAETVPIYRCWDNRPGEQYHYLTTDSNCNGVQVDGLIGYLYKEQKTGTKPLYQCNLEIPPINFKRAIATFDENCEGLQAAEKTILGYLPETSSTETTTYYLCLGGKVDYMLSSSLACEGYVNQGKEFYFLTEGITTETPTGPPWPNEHYCSSNSDCESGYCDTDIPACAEAPAPSMTIHVIDSPDPVQAGSTLDYALTLANIGQSDISGATLTVTYPNEATYVNDDLPMTKQSDNVWSFSIPADDTYNGGITVQVNSNVINNTDITATFELAIGGEQIIETETTTVLSNIGLPTPGVPPLVPPPSPPATPPLPHQFYGLVNNGAAGMQILARMGTAQFTTTIDNNTRYGYTPLFLVTGTTNGTLIQFYVNNSYDQNYSFQQGSLTRLDLTYTPGGTPPAGPSCNDNILNQDETDVDCGGTICSKCPNGDNCNANRDCRSGLCKNGVCTKKPTPVIRGGGGGGGGGPARDFYGTQQPETTTEAECFDDWICDPWGPCVDGLKTRECFLNDYPECILELPKPSTEQICEAGEPEQAEPTCFDGIKNQDETYRDCGGSMCKPCDPNLPCRTGMDCVTGYCDPITQLCGWPPIEDTVKEVPKATSYTWLWILLGLVIIGGGGGAAYYFWMHKEGGIPENQRLKDLKAYVTKFRNKNVPREQLRAKLEEAGWKKQDIEKVLK